MNPVHELFVFARLNWRILALCLLVAILVAGLTRYDRNRGRFVPTQNIEFILDTRTGQYCHPDMVVPADPDGVPLCSDLAKRWW